MSAMISLLAYTALGTGGGLISLLISLLILCIVCAVIWWIIGLLPLPSPWKQIIMAIFALIVLLVILQRVGFAL
jgi:carbon starvation protein CstA